MSDRPAVWFKDFVGVGYRYHDVYMNVFPLFEDKMFAFRLWKNTVEWWPDDKIKLRFVEDGGHYWFVLYGGSSYSRDNTGFVRRMPVSENYERFKAGYEKKAILRFGIYRKNGKKKKGDGSNFDLEILKKSKSVYDIAFVRYSQLTPGSVEWKCIQENSHDDKKV
ncbi:MAG: hypothetical protein ACREAZ_05730 [Nitrososphaera sp.]